MEHRCLFALLRSTPPVAPDSRVSSRAPARVGSLQSLRFKSSPSLARPRASGVNFVNFVGFQITVTLCEIHEIRRIPVAPSRLRALV
jgi:hypothetical protein